MFPGPPSYRWLNPRASAPGSAARPQRFPFYATIIRVRRGAASHTRWKTTFVAATAPHADLVLAAIGTGFAKFAATRMHANPFALDSPDADAYFVGIPAQSVAASTMTWAPRSSLGLPRCHT